MAPRRMCACLTFVLVIFVSEGATDEIPTQTGETFTFTCPITHTIGKYRQIYVESIEFPSLTSKRTYDGVNDKGELEFIIATENILEVPPERAARYTLTTNDLHMVVRVAGAQVWDSGKWMCRHSSDNGNSTSTSGSVIGPTIITVYAPVVAMTTFMADVTEINWRVHTTNLTGQVTLNDDMDIYFGCQVWYTMGVPAMTGFWTDALDNPVAVDDSVWRAEDSNIHTESLDAEWAFEPMTSIFYFASVARIPDIGARNNTQFSCVATVPIVGTNVASIQVFSETPRNGADGRMALPALVMALALLCKLD